MTFVAIQLRYPLSLYLINYLTAANTSAYYPTFFCH